MSLLRDYIKSRKSTEEGVHAYVDDVTARYPQRDKLLWGSNEQVTCHWELGYTTRSDVAITALMLPFLLLGHFAARGSRINFTTYHYLTHAEARTMRRKRVLKLLLLPLTVFILVMVGIALVISLFGIIAGVFQLTPADQPPISAGEIALVGLVALFLLVFFLAAIKAQRRLWKLGQPPGTDFFQEQNLNLRSAAFEAAGR
jgi:hypothetical protein